MSDLAPRRSAMPSVFPGDPYSELLVAHSRLRRDQRSARDAWFNGLGSRTRTMSCSSSRCCSRRAPASRIPRNHPGNLRRSAVVAQDFREQTDALPRRHAARAHPRAPAPGPARSRLRLPPLPRDDAARGPTAHAARAGGLPSRPSPDESLIALRHALARWVEVLEGVLRAPRVPFRLFYAVLSDDPARDRPQRLTSTR